MKASKSPSGATRDGIQSDARSFRWVSVLASCAWSLASVASADLVIGSAISMSDAIEEISATYTEQTGTKIRHTFSGTNVIARQIEAGAPIDIFISADSATMDALVSKQLIEKETVRTVATNRLVVVVPAGNRTAVKQATDLEIFQKIAIADPQSVPAGIYAKKWLVGEAIWTTVSPKTIPLQNVRAALLAVETGNSDAGIVYRSDALSSGKVRIAFTVPIEKTGSVSYPAAVVEDTARRLEAGRYMKHLASAKAGAIFLKHGFGEP